MTMVLLYLAIYYNQLNYFHEMCPTTPVCNTMNVVIALMRVSIVHLLSDTPH